jgi:enamine deaminase RidA (YjgF/YER057c/UK114 family)
MRDITRLVTNPRRGRAVTYNGMVFLGGQVADDRAQDIEGQTAQVIAKIDALLTQCNSDKTRLLSAQIWLYDIARDFVGMNRVWDAWIDPASAPARATCQADMGASDVLIEVVVVAAATRSD